MNIVKNIIVIFENQNQHQLTNISGVNLNQQNNNNLDSLKEMLNDNLVLSNYQSTTSATSLNHDGDDPTAATATTKR